ncbi:glycosyltransferase [Chloroflexota bacterium]
MNGNLLNIVSFLGRDWNYVADRAHHEGLGKYSRLLCVEPPITIDTPFRKPKVFWEWLTRRRGLRQFSETLWLYKPVAIVPYYISHRFPFLRGANGVVMKASLTKVLERLDMRSNIVVMISAMQNYVIGMLKERLLCYTVSNDLEETFTVSAEARRRAANEEEEDLKRADIVFTFARSMYEKKRKFNPNTYFSPSAADVDFFMKSLDPTVQIPSDLLQTKKPRIGLIGHIGELHTDIDLFNYLAERHPEWSIIVVGALQISRRFRRSPAFMKWQKLPNIHYLGFKRYYEVLPQYLKGLDVCLLPYKINNYTASVFPNKLFQYLAGGKPVVSTDIPEIRPYGDVIAIARDHAEFEEMVEGALEEQSLQRIAQRIAVAKENSVEKRAEVKISLIKSLFNVKVAGASR